jgi:hypothetical protein
VAQEHPGPEKMSEEPPEGQMEFPGGGLNRPVILAGLRPDQNYRLNSAVCELCTLLLLVMDQE